MIVGAANYLIRFENRTVGHQWLKRFLKRNPEYHIRKQKPLAAERKHSHNRATHPLRYWAQRRIFQYQYYRKSPLLRKNG